MSVDNSPIDISALLQQLQASAPERDRRGGHAAEEKQAIADAGLLSLSIPVAYGGEGLAWSAVLRVVREVARVDSALAHLLAFHHLQIATVLIYGNDSQKQRWLPETVRTRKWWGNALNPRDDRLRAKASEEGFTLRGEKRFCSGARGSEWLTLSAHDADGALMLGVVSTRAQGVTVHEDWDAIGQRQTDSGTVSFDAVHLATTDVLRHAQAPSSAWHTVRALLGQLILVNLFAGLAQGALREARALAGAVDLADGVKLVRLGTAHVQATTASVMADRAGDALDVLWRLGEAVTPEQRTHGALAVAQAKVVTHQASLTLGQELFELGGARSTHGALALDRYWRNARVHTLHDSIDQKLAALGRWEVDGQFPPSFYQ